MIPLMMYTIIHEFRYTKFEIKAIAKGNDGHYYEGFCPVGTTAYNWVRIYNYNPKDGSYTKHF